MRTLPVCIKGTQHTLLAIRLLSAKCLIIDRFAFETLINMQVDFIRLSMGHRKDIAYMTFLYTFESTDIVLFI